VPQILDVQSVLAQPFSHFFLLSLKCIHELGVDDILDFFDFSSWKEIEPVLDSFEMSFAIISSANSDALNRTQLIRAWC